MKSFFRIIISLVLCAVLAACVAGYCVAGAFDAAVTQENLRSGLLSRDISGAFAGAIREFAGPYIEELEEKPVVSILFSGDLDERLDSFLESDDFKEFANDAVCDYAEGFVGYLRTGEGSWEPDREALLGLAGPLTDELIASGSALSLIGYGRPMVEAVVRAAIEETVLPYLEESVPDYSEVLSSRRASVRAAALRYSAELRDSGALLYAGAASAALLVIVAVLLPRKGRRVLCTGWPGLGLLAGGGGSWLIGKSAVRLVGGGSQAEGLFADVAETARGIAEGFADMVAAEARPFLIAGGVLLAVYILLSAVLPEKKKQRIRQY